MPLALWTLLWLNFRAVLRKTTRQMRTVRGVLFFLIGMCVLGLWIVRSIFLNSRMSPAHSSISVTTAPTAILLFCLLNLFLSAGERAVTFTPPEVDFLFPGPFSRRQLLIFKLIKTGLATGFSALLFSVVLGRIGGTFLCRLVGVWLLFQFFQLLAMVIALLQGALGERVIKTGRWWILGGLLLAAAVAAVQVMSSHHQITPALLDEMKDTTAAKIVLAPFSVFAHALLARRFLFDGLAWSAGAAGIDLLMAAVVIGLDANYLETSANSSARRYDRVTRMRRSGLAGLASATSSGWKFPMLPWLGGSGPILWRQSTTALRTARKLLMFLLIIAIGVGIFVSRNTDPRESIRFIIGITVYLNLVLSRMLKFDFRGDLDHMDVLRSLPLRSSAVAAAQLTIPATILSLVQVVLLITIGLTCRFSWISLAELAAFAIPINFLVMGIDNLIFLMFPSRPVAAVAGDMTLIGRQSIVVFVRLIALLVVAAVAAGFGAVAWFSTRHSWPITLAATWLPLPAAIGLIVWFTAMVFERFDPSVNTPA